MSTTSVYNALNGYIHNGSIDLWEAANGSADLAGMIPVLGLFSINSSYIVTSAALTLSPNNTTVRLGGQGFFNGQTSYAAGATLKYWETGDKGYFSFELALKTTFVFSEFFSFLPQTMQPAEGENGGLIWGPSILNDLSISSGTFTGQTGNTQLETGGFLPEPTSELLLAKTPMVGPYPLRLSGTMSMTTDTRNYPLLDLYARGNDTIIQGAQDSGVSGPSTILLSNPGLNIICQALREEQLGNTSYSTVELYAGFSIGGITGNISTLILSTGDVWSFSVVFDPETASLVQGLTQLLSIFGVMLPVPMNFPLLSDFYVAGMDIDLQNKTPEAATPTFSLLNFAITIRSDKIWQPPIPFVTFSNVGTRWVWGWTTITNEQGAEENIYTLNGSVFGTMNIGGSGNGGGVATIGPRDPSATPPGAVATGTGGKPVSILMSMSLPSFIISASLASGSYISISDALKYYFGNTGPSTGPQEMNITKLQFTADPIGQNYFAEAVIFFGDPENPDPVQGWQIDLIVFKILLEQLDFFISVNNGAVSGGVSGTLFLLQSDKSSYTAPRLVISAEYPQQDPETPSGWTLAGYLYPGTSINLTELVYQYIYGENSEVPEWVPSLLVDRLDAKYTTGTYDNEGNPINPSYLFGGTISMRWTPTIFGTTLSVNASASMDIEKKSDSDKASGKITGSFSVNKISLTASLTFGVPEPTYLFRVQFMEVWLQATTAWRGETNKRHQVVSLQLGGVTLGDILEYLVNLAAPTIGFSLDPPWDVLKQIDLSRFMLTIDPQENTVEFVFYANVDIVVAKIESIGVRYTKGTGDGKVDLILTGSFLGEAYTSDDPLAWDVVNDPPPSVPGQGASLINLRYIGVGQRVTFTGESPNTVAESIKMLRASMTPPPPDGEPMPNTMRYSSNSQWLIGLDLQLMETIDLGFIFNDPKLYGLSIALGGEKAGSLAGLRFEILYKKITNDIGMFRVEFQVPDMFRTIQLGVVSITLGIIVVEIYTNGNFKIDLGFPYNQDFSRSFSLQAYIFIGRGGFYFGLLNGDTSTQVPKISNGNFSPVIELGVGIAAGVGREIRAGILSGGAYVELQVIFQGVLAWFNPNSNGAASAVYFKAQGIAALHGKIYGSVDFAVVKVSVTLEAYAQISLIYECYQPLQITMMVSVKAQASVKILFVRIHFSFSVKLEISFVVGSAKPTPWILAGNTSGSSKSKNAVAGTYSSTTSGRNTLRLNPHRRLQAMRKTYHSSLQPLLMSSGRTISLAVSSEDLSDVYILQWKPEEKVFTDSPRKAHLTLLPMFTIANVPVSWDGTVPQNDSPEYRTAFVLFADSGMSVSATTAAACAIRSSRLSSMTANDSDTSLLAADILTQGLTLYAINALPRSSSQGNYITASDLNVLLEQLDLPEAMSDGLSISNLATFFSTNINLWITGDTDPRPDEKSAMVLPMPPFLRWTSEQAGDVDFSTENKIGSWYEWGITQFLETYFPVSGESGERPGTDDPATYESFTSFMFRDFCMMVMQNAVTEMQKHMKDTTVTVQTVADQVQSLYEVAETLPTTTVNYTIQSGDTIDSVAANLGATVEELEFLNENLIDELATQPVGTVLSIVLGVSPEALAVDNPDTLFAVTQCTLGDLVHQAAQDETLNEIASLFQVPDAATMLSYENPAFPSLAAGSNILQYNAAFTIPAQVFRNAPADFDQLRTAAVFYFRYAGTTEAEKQDIYSIAEWYMQAIAEINQEKLETLYPEQAIPSVVELPPGQTLTVPNSFGAEYSEPENTNTYTTVAGDTLGRIGFSLALQQDDPDSATLTGWQTFKTGVTSAGANSWNIPEYAGVKIESGQTFESLVRRMIVDATWISANNEDPTDGTWDYNWTSVQAWAGPATILIPLASVTVPNAKTAVSSSLSFTSISKTYGLTITDTATRVKDVNGLFAEGTVLLVKLLPAQDIDVLMSQILQGDSFASIVNQSSRMLMSGLQLPGLKTVDEHVVPDEENPLPLYDLTVQQFTLPVDAAQPDETALALELYSEESWIQLFNSITVQEGQTLEQLEQQYPELLTYNPGLSESNLTTGMVLLTDPVSSLDYSYTNAEVIADSPASGLAVQPIPTSLTAPTALPVSGTVPKTYGLEHRIELQTPVTLPIPQAGNEPVTGNPGMWPMPSELQAKALSGIGTLYEVLAAPLGDEAGSQAVQIESCTYGTIIPFKVKKLDDNFTRFNLIGVDTDYRTILISLSNWLREGSNSSGTQSFQLLSPSPDANNTSGLTVLTAAPADAFLIKSNLSTLSVPPSLDMLTAKEAPAAGEGETYYASMSSLADFLMLLWEGSVVGGTGYYFSPGQELPGSAVDQQGNITLQVLVIVGSQQAVAADGRSLLPFNNCVLIGPGNENTSLSLFLQSAGSNDSSETVTQALVPPGNIGFEMLMKNPETETADYTSAEITLKTYFSLLSFLVAPTPGSPFAATSPGLPVLPNPTEGDTETTWEKQRRARKNRAAGLKASDEDISKPYWQYSQVMPVSRFIVPGTTLAGADVKGLPSPADDPYQGYGTQTSLPSATFVFSFGDVLGNRTGQNGVGQGTTSLIVGYTDTIIGIGDWPSIGRYYEVKTSQDGAILSLSISPRASELLPTPSQSGTVNADVIQQQQDQYESIYYQLIQPGVTGAVVSSLHFVADANYGNAGSAISDISPLWKFAAGSYAVFSGLTQMTNAKPEGTTTLDGIIEQYGIRYTELAQANADTLIASLFGTTLPAVPAYYPYVENRSVNDLNEMLPNGWPKATNVSDVLQLPENIILPLKTGNNIIIPALSIATGTAQPTASIQALADSNHTTVYDLAIQNKESRILEIGFIFTMVVDDSTTVTVTVSAENNSLTLVTQSFAEEGVNTNEATLAEAQKDSPGMFAAGQVLSCNTYLVKEDDTLAVNSSGASTSQLASLNTETPNLFDPGALVYFGNFTGVNDDNSYPTLQEFADRFACPAELLLSNNGTFTLPVNSAFVIPGTLSWPDTGSAGIQVPYTIRANETLNAIAARFDFSDDSTSAANQLAAANENMPGTITPEIDLVINVNGTNYTVNTGDDNPSYSSVLQSLQEQAPEATLQDIVSSTGDTPGVLFASGLLLCPPAKFQQLTSPDAIETIYGVSARSFALANTAMLGLIAAGQTVYNADRTASVLTADNDTFNSIIARFADQGATMSASDIVLYNPTVTLFRQDGIAFVPPAEIRFSVNIGTGGPYAGAVVPLQASLRLLRPSALIYPSFRTPTGTGPVEMAESDFPAPTSDSSADSGLTLNTFIEQMMVALPDLRIGTGKVSGIVQDLWQVNFDSNGISKVQYVGGTTVNEVLQPRFFALKPLYHYLVTRTVGVSLLKSDGTLGETQDISFQSIDTELWARRFVEDMDLFLTGPYAVAVYSDTVIRSQLQAVLNAKEVLIPKIADGLDALLVIDDPDKEAGLDSAKESLQQQLGVSLSKTYEANVLVQFNSVVTSPWVSDPELKGASLYGDGTLYQVPSLDEAGDEETRIPGITMIAAKTDLTEANGFVNFLLMVDNPALHRDVSGNFAYDLSHFEFNISGENMPGDYKSSDWLTFLPVLKDTDKPSAITGPVPAETDIPVPLRIFPGLPQIGQQVAVQTAADGSQDISQLSLWQYAFSYTHEHAEQDYVLITAEFNLTSPLAYALAEVNQDLFSTLAQYMTVADQLWPMLNGLVEENSSYSKTQIENAVTTYAGLVTNVGTYWNVRLSQTDAGLNNGDSMIAAKTVRFNARVNYDDLDDKIESLTLNLLSTEAGPSTTWPDAWIYGSKTVEMPGGEVTEVFKFYLLDKQPTEGNKTNYTVPADVNVPSSWPQFKIAWSDVNVAQVQNARVKLSVQRNQDLLEGVSTNPEFIFSTDTVIAPAIVTPLNTFGDRVDITSLGTNLTEALNNCFTALFGTSTYGQKVTMSLSYGFELVPPSDSDPGLTTYLPIGLYPNQTLSATTAAEINAMITEWKNINNPVTTGGEWVFSLKQYSQLTDNTQMLLNIEHLVYRLSGE